MDDLPVVQRGERQQEEEEPDAPDGVPGEHGSRRSQARTGSTFATFDRSVSRSRSPARPGSRTSSPGSPGECPGRSACWWPAPPSRPPSRRRRWPPRPHSSARGCDHRDGIHTRRRTAFIPVAGLVITTVRYTASFWIFRRLVFMAFALLLAHVSARCLLASSRPTGAPAAPPSPSPVSAPCAERDGGTTPQGARSSRAG